MFERKAMAEKNCQKLSRQLKDQERNSNERMAHACAKIRKANEREKLVAVSDATVGLQDELKKSVRGAECLKRNVMEAKVPFLIVYPHPYPTFTLTVILTLFRCKTPFSYKTLCTAPIK